MNTKLFGWLVLIILIASVGYFFITRPMTPVTIVPVAISPATTTSSYKDATYIINGQQIHLVDGKAETEVAPGSASKILTSYFGNELIRDINGDGKPDVVFLLTQTGSGSGTFFYVVAALATTDGYKGSQGLLLGDRIAPQATTAGKGAITIVNFADRAPNESFTTLPSVGKSLWLLLDTTTMQFGEVVKDFTGEADPAKMTLDMKKWDWEKALYNNGKTLIPKKTNVFTVTFEPHGVFSATTDCNKLSGTYITSGQTISFKKIISTKMFCEGSQESDFSKLLQTTTTYHFTTKGELILELAFDSGTVIFK